MSRGNDIRTSTGRLGVLYAWALLVLAIEPTVAQTIDSITAPGSATNQDGAPTISAELRAEIARLPAADQVAWARDVLRRHSAGIDPGVSTESVEFSDDVIAAFDGLLRSNGLRAVSGPSGNGNITIVGKLHATEARLDVSKLALLHPANTSGTVEFTVSDNIPCCTLHSDGIVQAGSIEADLRAGFTYPELFDAGAWTGDDGGTGVTYVEEQNCGFLGFADCIRVDENETVCTGGSFVVGARLWMTDTNQVGVQVRCTDPGLTP